MLELTGTLALIGALSACLAALIRPVRRLIRPQPVRPKAPVWLLTMAFSLSTISLFCLTLAFLNGRSDLAYVSAHSHETLGVLYRIAAVWAGQEGSLLLWAWMLLGWGMTGCLLLRKKQESLLPMTAWIIAAAAAFFLALLVFEAGPFVRLMEVHADGRIIPAQASAGGGLNPLLHHPLMVIHPPVLFMGYAGFTIPLALAMAALWVGPKAVDWISLARRWTLAAWWFLTVGIILGARWAYVELGWGGYWGWDPVENASLLPWLIGTALLHAMAVHQRRGIFVRLNLVLVIGVFLLCLFGTFLTRSGIVASVHAFSTSSIGLYFILGITTAGGFSFGLLAARLGQLRDEGRLESVSSREGASFFNILILLMACLLIMVGTLFPVISETATGRAMSLGVEYYERAFLPVGLLILFLMAMAPGLRWRKTSGPALKRLLAVAGIGMLLGGALGWTLGLKTPAGLLTSGLIAAVLFGAAVDLIASPIGDARRWGGHISHAGIALMALGILGSAFERQTREELFPGDVMRLGDYRVEYLSIDHHSPGGREFDRAVVNLRLWRDDREIVTLAPEKRFYHRAGQATSEVAIYSTLLEDLYAVFSGLNEDGRAVIMIHRKPLIAWLWIGSAVLALGTLLAIAGRTSRKEGNA